MNRKFMSWKDSYEKCLMHFEIENGETITVFGADEITEELFHSFLHRYQVGLEQSMKDFASNFAVT